MTRLTPEQVAAKREADLGRLGATDAAWVAARDQRLAKGTMGTAAAWRVALIGIMDRPNRDAIVDTVEGTMPRVPTDLLMIASRLGR